MTKGGVVVRAGDVDADRHLALDLFARCLNPQYDNARFDWVYRQNPHGRGQLWVATDPVNHDVVGIAGAFPRRMCVSGREELAWVLGDFCVGQAYRTVGPALALQRACLAPVTAGAIPFCYDFPSSGMMPVYQRLGIKPLGRMVRLTRPLNVEARLRELVGSRTVTRGLSALARVFLAPRNGRRGVGRGLELSMHAAPFGDEFTELYRQFAHQPTVMVERSAEYLNWRYRANPVHQHEIITARRAHRLVGYAICRQEDRAMTLVDLFGGTDALEMVAELVHRVVALAWERRLDAVHISLLETSAWIQCLKRLGFRKRETRPVVVYASQEAGREVCDERSWLLLHGDRDS